MIYDLRHSILMTQSNENTQPQSYWVFLCGHLDLQTQQRQSTMQNLNPRETNPCDFNNLKQTTATRFNTHPTPRVSCVSPLQRHYIVTRFIVIWQTWCIYNCRVSESQWKAAMWTRRTRHDTASKKNQEFRYRCFDVWIWVHDSLTQNLVTYRYNIDDLKNFQCNLHYKITTVHTYTKQYK
jgi:hypothetical protein